jgi:hypothetical protein
MSGISPFWSGFSSQQQFQRLDRDVGSFDVAIIGAGWIGLLAALRLGRSGVKTALIDAGVFGTEATGNSGGLLLDKTEIEASSLIGIYGEDTARSILGDSLYAIEEIKNEFGASFDFQPTGHLTAFRTEGEKIACIRSQKQLHALLPDQYPDDPNHICFLSAEQTGAAHYFPYGAIYSPYGGVFNPAKAVRFLVKEIKKTGFVTCFEGSTITGLENAAHGSIKLQANTTSGCLDASRVVLAGGSTYKLLGDMDGLPNPQPIWAGMVSSSEPLSQKLRRKFVCDKYNALTPCFSAGLTSTYWRIESDGHLLFGSGAAIGDDAKDLERRVQRDVATSHGLKGEAVGRFWARRQYFNRNYLPFVCVADWRIGKDHNRGLVGWPETFAIKDHQKAQIIGAFGLGGQGNNFGPYLGLRIAEMLLGKPEALYHLKPYNDVMPDRTFTMDAALKRISAERRMLAAD